jgi:bla regulator protein BlaR1
MELHLTNLVPDQLIKALCGTLIHSLWQGLILAALTGMIIVLTKKTSAAIRYNLMIGLLVLFSTATTVTFFVELHLAGSKEASPIAINTTTVQQVQASPDHAIAAEKSVNILSNCINYFNTHSDTIVLMWFLIICARCVQLAAGLHNIYYFKRTKVLSAGTYWNDKVIELSHNLGIKRTVQIMQSGIAKLPMVLGHFKPVILVPIGLLTALTTEEVESILVHELAHIRRRDYLVNLLQHLMEIIFFFNPAVLWVSALIKAERENCCDDIVVAQTNSKVSYIKALVSCHEHQSSIPAYAMGLGGNNDHFLQRVKRMLSNNNQSLNRVEKMVLTICLISAVLLTAAFSGGAKDGSIAKTKLEKGDTHQSTKTDSMVRTASLKNDTDIMGTGTLRIYKPGEIGDGSMLRFTKKVRHQLYLNYVIKKEGVLYQYTAHDDGSNATYYVNGNAVSGDKLAEYQPKFNQLISQLDQIKAPKAPAEPGQLQHNGKKGEIVDEADARAKANADRTDDQLTPSMLSEKVALDSMKRLSVADRTGAKRIKLKATLSALDTQRAIAAYKMARLDSGKWAKNPKVAAASKYAAYDATYGPKVHPAYPPKPISPPAYKSYQFAEPKEPSAPQSPPSPAPTVGDKITAELLKDNLVKDKANYVIRITNQDLYIDGVKQSDELHDQIINKYLKPGDRINYTRTSSTKSN